MYDTLLSLTLGAGTLEIDEDALIREENKKPKVVDF
jgi:hypothetical protein